MKDSISVALNMYDNTIYLKKRKIINKFKNNYFKVKKKTLR